MKLTVFAKKRTTKEGKPFHTYLTRLKKKNGDDELVTIRFTSDFKPNPSECPMNIEVDKKNANLTTKKICTAEKELMVKTLWVKEYIQSNEVYRDTSLDDYE